MREEILKFISDYYWIYWAVLGAALGTAIGSTIEGAHFLSAISCIDGMLLCSLYPEIRSYRV